MHNEMVIPSDGFLRLEQVLALIPISKSSWWAGVKSGKFPPSVKLGKRTTCWLARDIRDLINRLAAREVA